MTNDELRAIAKAATPGPWHRQTEGNRSIRALAGLVFRMLNRNPLNTDATYVLTFDEKRNVCFVGNGPRQTENGEYIATFDPRRALAACDLADAVKQEIKRLEQSNGLHQYDRGIHRMPGCGACDMLARLRATLARWEALA